MGGGAPPGPASRNEDSVLHQPLLSSEQEEETHERVGQVPGKRGLWCGFIPQTLYQCDDVRRDTANRSDMRALTEVTISGGTA